MDRWRIGRELAAAGRRLDELGLVPARDGNLSARIAPDRILITPTAVRKRELAPGRMVEVDLTGRVRGEGRASTELGMHLAVYRARDDVQAVVHAHPPTAVGFACAGRGLTDCLMPEVAVALGAVPLTPYATPGTGDLEASIQGVVRDHEAFLLANHGAVTMGASLDQALDRMEILEQFAKVSLTAHLLGGPTPLGPGSVAALEELRRRAGDDRPVTCEPASVSAPAGDPAPASPPPDPRVLADLVEDALRGALRELPERPHRS